VSFAPKTWDVFPELRFFKNLYFCEKKENNFAETFYSTDINKKCVTIKE